jgi:hypothetical protein
VKILFLDVDGPLIPARMYFNGPPTFGRIADSPTLTAWKYDPVAVGMIQTLIGKYDVRIVYNSTHNQFGDEYLLDQAIKNGFYKEDLHEEFRTEYPLETYSRSEGINRWLRKHPEVTHWCDVDDALVQVPNFVKVNFNVGITIENFEEIERYFRE